MPVTCCVCACLRQWVAQDVELFGVDVLAELFADDFVHLFGENGQGVLFADDGHRHLSLPESRHIRLLAVSVQDGFHTALVVVRLDGQGHLGGQVVQLCAFNLHAQRSV